jgi:hypothetical protein
MAAHILASKVEETLPCVWMEDPPNFLIDVIANNVLVFSKIYKPPWWLSRKKASRRWETE